MTNFTDFASNINLHLIAQAGESYSEDWDLELQQYTQKLAKELRHHMDQVESLLQVKPSQLATFSRRRKMGNQPQINRDKLIGQIREEKRFEMYLRDIVDATLGRGSGTVEKKISV